MLCFIAEQLRVGEIFAEIGGHTVRSSHAVDVNVKKRHVWV